MFSVINSSPNNILVQWIVQRSLLDACKRYVSGRIIDIGCGTKPYRNLLKPFVTEHIGVDHEKSFHDKGNVDLIGTAYSVPSPDASFDSALCTAVLEHLEEPEQALRECHRLLKPSGVAIYSVPFIWHIHEEPRDFYRFSKYGLEYLFKKTGFEIIEIKPLSGFWVTFGQLFVYNLYRFNRGPLRWFRILDLIALILQGGAYILDLCDRTEQWTWMYLVIARKNSL